MKKFFRAIVTYFYVPLVLAILFSFGSCASIMYDFEDYFGIALFLLFASVAVQPIIVIAAMLQRRWLIAGLAFLGFAVSAVLTLFTIVAIAAGQHHPPVYNDLDDIVDTLAVDDSLYVDTLEVVEDTP